MFFMPRKACSESTNILLAQKLSFAIAFRDRMYCCCTVSLKYENRAEKNVNIRATKIYFFDCILQDMKYYEHLERFLKIEYFLKEIFLK